MASNSIITNYPMEFFGDGENKPTNWRKEKHLGSGAYGDVFHAKMLADDSDFAVKTFKTAFLNDKQKAVIKESIKKEINALKKLSHEKIIKLYGVCSSASQFCIFIEFMPEYISKTKKSKSHKKDINLSCQPKTIILNNSDTRHYLARLFISIVGLKFPESEGSLSNFIECKSKIAEKHSSLLAKQILEGVAYLHSQNLFHRDISSNNILMQDKYNVKLADFGLTREFEEITQSCTKDTMATIRFMAPEMLNGSRYNKYVDICQVAAPNKKSSQWVVNSKYLRTTTVYN